MGRENASAREGGRRRRSSPTPGCNDPDMVKARQGKPSKKASQRMQCGMQMTGGPPLLVRRTIGNDQSALDE
jgi:hypothetical protein